MKLNLGCGFRKHPECVNVDSDPNCEPDKLVDLEATPWPFEENSIDEILADHVFEHLGSTTKIWLDIWKEIYRISKNDCLITINVPHPRHDNFLTDPTHVRPIFPGTIAMFDQMRNIKDMESGGQETKLGLMTGIDLEMVRIQLNYTEPWASGLRDGKITEEQVSRDVVLLNNVCQEIKMQVRIIKPARGLGKMKEMPR